MNSLDLLSAKELPLGFSYPQQFMHIIELGLIDLSPWYLLEGKSLRDTIEGLSQRYPERNLIPFARRQDNDDIACWQASSKNEVFIVHDFASPGWELHSQFTGFYDWFRFAIEDLIEFDT